jgi:hypothetical protein
MGIAYATLVHFFALIFLRIQAHPDLKKSDAQHVGKQYIEFLCKRHWASILLVVAKKTLALNRAYYAVTN